MSALAIAGIVLAAVGLLAALAALWRIGGLTGGIEAMRTSLASREEALTRIGEHTLKLHTTVEEQRKAAAEEMKLLHQALQAMLASSDKRLSAGLEEAHKAMLDVTGRLAALDAAGKDLKDAVNRLAELRRMLAAPSGRGSFGERLMEEWLRDVLPAKYVLMQHQLKSGERVDLAIRVGERVIPVDSKFPSGISQALAEAEDEEKLKTARRELARNLRSRINETAKYVRPGEGTYPFALMFVPSEAAFMEIVRDPEVLQYALDKKVIPVSPSTFLAYLEVIHEGLRGFEVEEKTRFILEQLSILWRHVKAAEDGLDVHEKHLRNATGSLAQARKALAQLADSLQRVQAGQPPGPEAS